MKKIDLSFEIQHLTGTKIGVAGDIVANQLVAAQGVSDPLKFYLWGLSFSKGETVQMDVSDFKKFKEFIENHPQMMVIIKAPIIQYLDNLKEQE